MKRTVILGGGSGGVVAANILKKWVGPTMRVTVVDKETKHFYASSYPRALIGERRLDQLQVPLKQLENKRIEFRHCQVQALDFPRNRVVTDRGEMEYDYLIISLGTEYHPETVPGFSEFALNPYDFQDIGRIKERLEDICSGHIVLFISSLPYKCPPAPYEIMMLLHQFFLYKGIRHKVKLTVVTPEYSPEPLAGPKVGQRLRNMLAQKGIELLAEAKVLAVERDALLLDHGVRLPADLLLGIAPHWTAQALRDSDIVDKNGFVEVDQYSLETKYKGVYAIGDATAIKLPVMGAYAPKAGVFAHAQAKVVAQNIGLLAEGKAPEFFYDGKGFCVMNAGFGQGCFSLVHYYKKPAPHISLLKPTKAAYLLKVGFAKYWLNNWF